MQQVTRSTNNAQGFVEDYNPFANQAQPAAAAPRPTTVSCLNLRLQDKICLLQGTYFEILELLEKVTLVLNYGSSGEPRY